MDGKCNTSHVTNGQDHGKCTDQGDGDSSCTLNGVVYNHPMTVWRGLTYQAESAEGGGFDASGNWSKGAYGFVTGCSSSVAGCAIIDDDANGNGHRVGYIGPSKGIKFSGVNVASSGTANIVVYYTNGDDYALTRYLQFKVNGSAAQVRPFGGLRDWKHPRGATISLSGFSSGSNNTIYVTADPTHSAPDLDWIEIVNSDSTVPSTGLCDPSLWSVSSNVSGCESPADAVDGDLTDRWSTGKTMSVGDYYQVDFKGLVNLSSVTLNNTQTSGGDYPATVVVYTSQDGSSFSTTPVDSANGASNKTVISFTQVNVRAIRVKVTGARSGYWSIGELQAGCSL